MTAWARSSDIGGPYGVSKGILSGTKSRGFVSVGCSARLAVAAFPVFSFDIRPPSMVAVQIARSTMNRNSLWLPRSPQSRLGVSAQSKREEMAVTPIPASDISLNHHLGDRPIIRCGTLGSLQTAVASRKSSEFTRTAE